MSEHRIPVPTRLQRPQCACGWTPSLPWPVSWERWHADAEAHLQGFIQCPKHGTQAAADDGQCVVCRHPKRTIGRGL